MFFFFLTSGLFLLTGISIQRSAEAAAKDFQKTLKTGLKVRCNLPMMFVDDTEDENGELVFIRPEGIIYEHHIEEFLEIEGVSGFYGDTLVREIGYTGLSLRPGYEAWCMDIINGDIPLGGEVTKEFRKYLIEECKKATEVGMHSNSFLEVYDSEWHPAFVNGALELVEGRHIRMEDKQKVLVSDEIAERNGLNIGDKITARWTDIFSGEVYGRAYETEIVGIFHINFEQEVVQDVTYERDIMANMFFNSYDLEQFHTRDYQTEYGMPVFAPRPDDCVSQMTLFVDEPALLDSVKEKLLAIDSIKWDQYDFEIYDKDYQTAAAPLLSIMKFSVLLAMIPAIGVLILLFLVFLVWMRSRKHEIGILASIGVKKNTILLQLLTECFGIAAAAFLVSLLLAGPVTRYLGDGMQTLFYASGETEKYEMGIQMETDRFYVNMLPPEKEEALSYTITWKESCIVCLVLMGTALLSVWLSSRKALNQPPREILERK